MACPVMIKTIKMEKRQNLKLKSERIEQENMLLNHNASVHRESGPS